MSGLGIKWEEFWVGRGRSCMVGWGCLFGGIGVMLEDGSCIGSIKCVGGIC